MNVVRSSWSTPRDTRLELLLVDLCLLCGFEDWREDGFFVDMAGDMLDIEPIEHVGAAVLRHLGQLSDTRRGERRRCSLHSRTSG